MQIEKGNSFKHYDNRSMEKLSVNIPEVDPSAQDLLQSEKR